MQMRNIEEIDAIIKESIPSLNLMGEPRELYAPIEYIFSIGGKRIRPKLSLLTYSIFKDSIDQSVIFPSLAIEVFHSFTLIHDDIMDNADVRRGHPTIHKKWNDNIAILSGDVMSIKAYEYLLSAPKDSLDKVMSLFNHTAAQVCEGQQYDMNFEDLNNISIEDYLMMIGLKTAVLIACSAKMGAIIGGAPIDKCDILYDFGYKLGIAFQITDDYLDTFGDPKVFGKNIGGDITNNKKSWLLVSAMKEAKGQDALRLSQIMSMTEDEKEAKIAAMQDLYISLGIKKSAEEAIEKYYDKAINSLKKLNLNEESFHTMEQFALSITYRKK